jgi:hypothetical protein
LAQFALEKLVSIVGAAHRYVSGIISVDLTNEALDVEDISTVGLVLLRNLDATNFVVVTDGLLATTYTVRMNAGEFALFRAGSNTIVLKADSLACNVQYVVFEA